MLSWAVHPKWPTAPLGSQGPAFPCGGRSWPFGRRPCDGETDPESQEVLDALDCPGCAGEGQLWNQLPGLLVDTVWFCPLDLNLGAALRGIHPSWLIGAQQRLQTVCSKTQVTGFTSSGRAGALPLPFTPLLPCPHSAEARLRFSSSFAY